MGKRATLWLQDLALDLEAIDHLLATQRTAGLQGHDRHAGIVSGTVRRRPRGGAQLERSIAAKLGGDRVFAVTGQTYPRKADAQVLDVLSGVAQSAAKFAVDLRLLQHEGELLEPFESEQIGSSAMAYKRNPMRAERIGALARHVISLQANGAHTAAAQWLERTLDDSANRRLTLPEAFLAVDAILLLAGNIASGLEVREGAIGRHVAEQMPFMVTERWLMLAVQAGGDRQALHAVIRRHSLAAAESVAAGEPNDLLDRLVRDGAFDAVKQARLEEQLDPVRYVGRAPEQVAEFFAEYLDPLVASVQLHGTPAPDRRVGGVAGMIAPLVESALPLPLWRRGKVREVYEVSGDRLLIVASDRVSAFDVVMNEAVPDKGRVLTQLSAHWFRSLAGVTPSHFITADTDEIIGALPSLADHREQIAGRAMLVRRTAPVAFECVVRGYLAGSAWAEYRAARNTRRRIAGRRASRVRALQPAGLLASDQGRERSR